MPEKATRTRAQRAREAGKAPSTQAGEFVREEMEHVREGKHGVRSTQQALRGGASRRALARQGRRAARRRSRTDRSRAARKAAATRKRR
ncbi:MAG: hypothetical protein ACREMN_05040 [Gemmatimonadales bacterium]